MSRATTIDFPVELPVVKRGEHWIARSGDIEIRLSNLDKVYWPEEGFTKGDLVTYYFNISPVMLPHIVGRPLTMKRMPDGVAGDFFYEKNAPVHAPDWMPTIPVVSAREGRTINFLTVGEVAHMLWLANMGCIEFHPLHARGTEQAYPDYAFFDLDPMGKATWADVQEVAALVKVVLDRFDIACYPKTSGATGMQIYIPLVRKQNYDEVRGFVGTVSDIVHEAAPDITTVEWEVRKRENKIFLDVNMNREGANIAAAYSVRPEPGGTVSMPFSWDELDDVHPGKYTMATVWDRVFENDPFLPVSEEAGYDLTEPIMALDAKPRKARDIRAR